MLKKRKAANLFIVFISLAVPLFFQSCGGDSDSPSTGIKAGYIINTTLSVNDQPVQTVTYKAYDLEPEDNKEAIVLLAENLTTLVPNSGIKLNLSEESIVTIDDVMYFLQNHWDGYSSGTEDAGLNSFEFVEFLKKYNIDINLLLIEFNKANSAGMSVADFVSAVEAVGGLLKTDSANGYLGFLRDTGVNMKVLTDILAGQGITMEEFIAQLNQYSISFGRLYELYKRSGESMGDFIGSLQAFDEERISTAAEGGGGLDVAKWVYDIIKENKPQAPSEGAFTSVLNSADTNPLNYEYALNSTGDKISFAGTDYFGITLYSMEFRATATYNASNVKLGGHYLPNIHYDVTQAYALWPWSLSAVAQVSNVSNLGSASDPDPEVDMTINVNASWLIQAFHQSFTFRFTGLEGIISQE
jgi:hypothetical protein